MRAEFTTAQRIIFGAGAIEEIGRLASGFGIRALLVHGSGGVSIDPIKANLGLAGVQSFDFSVGAEPDTNLVQVGLALAKSEACQLVIGVGGGSVMDTAKAIGAMLNNPGNLLDYLERVGKGLPLLRPSVPVIAVPTTAGTGAEVTRNAVLAVPGKMLKVSMRSAFMLPSVALVDPELTYSCPPAVTAFSGLDALTQNIEAYTTRHPNPLVDGFARDGIRLAAGALRTAYRNGADVQAREDMALSSLFGGLSLANAGLGAVHGFAGVVGGLFGAPHGAICGGLLPGVLRANYEALQAAALPAVQLGRYEEIAAWLCGRPGACFLEGIAALESSLLEFKVPRLSAYGISADEVGVIIQNARDASSMRKNPIELSDDLLRRILLEAI